MSFLLGKLSWDAIPFNELPAMLAGGGTIILAVLIMLLITYFKKWTYLWKEWLTSVDHKKIGVMYIVVAIIMLVRGFADALLMRAQQAMAVGSNHGFLPPHHYDQIFTAHGVILLFFMAMPFMFGLMNIVIPLQIGARDVAFPFLNSLSFWLMVAGVILMMISLFIGEFSQTGWLAYPPLSEKAFSPGVGVDYYIWAVQISSVGSLLTGINFFVTILRMRCPGMNLMRMPVFIWASLCANILIIIVFPVLTVALGMLALDRYLDFHFFSSSFGGNPMMYVNMAWIWGHPEVYILVLPAFGIYSEIVPTFCKKRLFGYTTMVYATCSITVLAFVVWLHHFFTMGSGADVNSFFGIATMIISIPTGVKVFNWLFTMYRGRITYRSPMYWTIAFMVTFSIGGMTGVMLSIPGIDFLVHNSLFLVGHFHNTIIGGVVFGYIAGLVYWFPKAFGFKLHEKLGIASFWCWIVGFYIAFMPLYLLGFMGATRRMNHYDNPSWQPLFIIAAIGAVIILVGILLFVVQVIVSIIQRKQNLDKTGDPWDGRSLEWSTSSPPPFYNFAFVPEIHSLEPFWDNKQDRLKHPEKYATEKKRPYEDIHMPKNTSLGVIIGLAASLFGFGMIWDMWWLAGLSAFIMFVSVLYRSFDYDTDYYVKASEVEKIENEIAKRNAL